MEVAMFTHNKAEPEQKLIKKLLQEVERVEKVHQALLQEKNRPSHFCAPEKIHETNMSQIEADCLALNKAKESLEAKVQEIKDELERQKRVKRLFEELKIDFHKLIMEMGLAFHVYLKEFSKKKDYPVKSQVQFFLNFAFDEIFAYFYDHRVVDRLGVPDAYPKKSNCFVDKSLNEVKEIVNGIYDKCIGSLSKLNIDLIKSVEDKKAQEEVSVQIKTATRKSMDVFTTGLQKLTDMYDPYFKLKEAMPVIYDPKKHPIFKISEEIILKVPDCTDLLRRNARLVRSVEEYTQELRVIFDESVEEAEKLFNDCWQKALQFQQDCDRVQKNLETTLMDLKEKLECKSTSFEEKNTADLAYQQAVKQSTELLKSGLHQKLREEFKRGRDLYQGINFNVDSEKKCIEPVLQSFDTLSRILRRVGNNLLSSEGLQANLEAHRQEARNSENESAIKLFLKFLDRELFSHENLKGFLHIQTSTFGCLGGINIRVSDVLVRVPTGVGLMATELKNHNIDQLNSAGAQKLLQITLQQIVSQRKKVMRGRLPATDRILDAILAMAQKQMLLLKDVEDFELRIKSLLGLDGSKLNIGNRHRDLDVINIEVGKSRRVKA